MTSVQAFLLGGIYVAVLIIGIRVGELLAVLQQILEAVQ